MACELALGNQGRQHAARLREFANAAAVLVNVLNDSGQPRIEKLPGSLIGKR
jgi:hypothetical protein